MFGRLSGYGEPGHADMLHRCQLCIEIRGGYVEDVGA